jgi:hypothetical protein
MQATHNEQQRRFELVIDGHVAKAEYRRDGDDTLVFHHTLVPDALRGQGLAGKVVKAGLDYARKHNLKVVPMCSYVATYIERHPEYQQLLSQP